MDYEWEVQEKLNSPLKKVENWTSRFGFNVISRDEKGFADEIEITVYVGSKNSQLYLIGDFNGWSEDLFELQKYKFTIDDNGIAKLKVSGIKHKQAYKLLQVQDLELKYHQDPAGVYFDDEGNSIFWDFADPSCYQQKYSFINTFERSTKILQTDLAGLIVHYKNNQGSKGSDLNSKSYYKFITESGVIKKIKKFGFNTIQFLPFAQSIDGENWKYSYLVPFLFAIQKNWGTPDEFAEMIDEFHKYGIAVISDVVLGHMPYRDFEIFGRNCKKNGIHTFIHDDNFTPVYIREETSWGTKRPDFSNPFIRNYLIDSCIHFQKYYGIDGFRIDNVDGILRYGTNGDGDERVYGRTFLRDLHQELYSFNCYTLIHLEAHYFYEDNAKLLVAPLDSDPRALGATAYNESRLAYFFHKEYMLKKADEISVWKFKHIIDEKEWGKSNSTVADFHNHDAAAGLMEERATGAYAGVCMTSLDSSALPHAIGRIVVMEAIISFMEEGRTLDLLQTFLLQQGTFEHDSSINWEVLSHNNAKYLIEVKKQINLLLDNSSFWPLFTKNREIVNVDDKNKVLVCRRTSDYKGVFEEFVIIINTSNFELFDYKIGLKEKANYLQVFNSNHLVEKNSFIFSAQNSTHFKSLKYEISSHLGPYEVQVYKRIKE